MITDYFCLLGLSRLIDEIYDIVIDVPLHETESTRYYCTQSIHVEVMIGILATLMTENCHFSSPTEVRIHTRKGILGRKTSLGRKALILASLILAI